MLLPGLELTASGRPSLVQGECEHAFLEKADIQFETEGGTHGHIAKRHEDGFAILTTHRLIWVDAARAPSPGASCYILLQSVEGIELSATKLWTQTKLRIRVHLDQQRRPSSGHGGFTLVEEIRLVSRSYGNFAEQARTLLYQRAWERSTQAPPQPKSMPSAYSQIGLQQVAPPPEVDATLLQQLTGMGFSCNRAVRACQATSNAGAEQALQWLFEHEGHPDAESAPDSQLPQHHPGFTSASSSPGIMGILRREEQIAAQNDRTLDEAFQDLRALMAKAHEMVQLAEKFRGTLSAKGEAAAAGETLDTDMQRQLIEIGIASPVTRDVAGALYHQQLSCQLADFLVPRMERAGGILTLADVYCLFNRARGTELISPDDLLQAVNLFPSINTSMHLRTFPSGVLVVQSNTHDDDEVCGRIAELVSGEGLGPAISATEVAAALSVPLTIAAQHLATAECKAVLCRDDGPEGLRFCRNFFEEVAAP